MKSIGWLFLWLALFVCGWGMLTGRFSLGLTHKREVASIEPPHIKRDLKIGEMPIGATAFAAWISVDQYGVARLDGEDRVQEESSSYYNIRIDRTSEGYAVHRPLFGHVFPVLPRHESLYEIKARIIETKFFWQ